MTYAEAIKELRKKLILTQTEFAELLEFLFNQLTDGKRVNMNLRLKLKENSIHTLNSME